ncbi:hypothetical protein [Microvirga splendida]|uniref:Uncharacterized protein n=1 Tax=Microvirga splendida TaxID=2795727 RepID=A0ABS0XWF2_9HYPH|nr:hypothetical protein [Microvirga splendida]MBJ6124337.1 hypothetical protein [Microvirga splendida]
MKRSLVVLGLLAAGAFLIPDGAAAQRGGPGFRGGAPSFRSGGGAMVPRIGMAGPRGFAGPALAGRPAFRGGAVGLRPGGFRPALAPGFRGYGRVVDVVPRYDRGWRYPYYGGYYRTGWGYPSFGGALLAGLTLGALSYPYYGYGYGTPYLYAGAVYGEECYWARRRVIDPWGRVVRRLVQVCTY